VIPDDVQQQFHDKEVKNLINDAVVETEDLIQKNIEKLHKLADALLERESLDGEEIDKLMNGENLPPVKKGQGGNHKRSSKKAQENAVEQEG